MDCWWLQRFPLGLRTFGAGLRKARDQELRAALKTAAAHLREMKKQESPRSQERQTYPELRALEAAEVEKTALVAPSEYL